MAWQYSAWQHDGSVAELVLRAHGAASCDAFRTFMDTPTADLAADDFVRLYEQMVHRPEAILLFAAGWCLVEAAIIRRKRLASPAENAHMLDEAGRVWSRAWDTSRAMLDGMTPRHELHESLLDLNRRIALCRSFLPAFSAISQSLDDHHLPAQSLLDETYDELLAFAEGLLAEAGEFWSVSRREQAAFRGLASELLVALLMHRANRREVVVVPPSPKYENCRNSRLRVDLFAYDYRDGDVSKTPIQVKTSAGHGRVSRKTSVLLYGTQVVLGGYDDSVAGRTAALAATLRAILAEHRGSNDPRVVARIRRDARELDALAAYVSAEIAAFKYRPHGTFTAHPERRSEFRPPWEA